MEPETRLATELMGLGDHDEYVRAAAEVVCSLFPSEMIGWVTVDSGAMSARIFAYPDPLPATFAGLLGETADENPFVQSYVADRTNDVWEARRLSDLMTDSELRRSRTYALGLQPLGIDRQIAVLSGRPSPVTVCAWTVARLHRDYTDTETALLSRIQPMLRLLEQAYGHTGLPATAELLTSAYALTRRELEILQLLSKGLTTAAAGHLLGISPRTVAKHLEHAYVKLGCTNRIDALRRLREVPQLT